MTTKNMKAKAEAAHAIQRTLESIGWRRLDKKKGFAGASYSAILDWVTKGRVPGFKTPGVGSDGRITTTVWFHEHSTKEYAAENLAQGQARTATARGKIVVPPAAEANPELLALRRENRQIKNDVATMADMVKKLHDALTQAPTKP